MPTIPDGRPTYCTIDLDNLCWNLRQVRAKVGPRVKILSMVKANGYGHGATAVARALAAASGDAFGVATLEEGLELRRAGIREPILVLAGTYIEQLDDYLENDLRPAVYDPEGLQRLETSVQARGLTLSVHLKIDTGMGRLGL